MTEAIETILEFKCDEERLVIGRVALPVGTTTRLTAAEVLRRFEPVDRRYKLAPTLRDGDMMRCPRCQRPVSVVGLLGKDEMTAVVVLGALTAKG
jgi:hypothetical protein